MNNSLDRIIIDKISLTNYTKDILCDFSINQYNNSIIDIIPKVIDNISPYGFFEIVVDFSY